MLLMSHEECAAHVARREELFRLIKKVHSDKVGPLVLCAAFEHEREPFYQDSSFYYLVGLQEPGVVLYQQRAREALLYEPSYGVKRSTWLPIAYDIQYLQELDITVQEPLGEHVPGYSLDAFVSENAYKSLAARIKTDLINGEYIFTPLSTINFECKLVIDKLCSLVPDLKARLVDIAPLIAQLRRKKEQRELEYLYRAIEITAIAQEAAAGVIKPGRRESDLQAAIDYIFAEAQATRAFASVVGGGKNSTILHYVDNKDVLSKNDLVVVDIGASFNHYCGDITRTYPVSGKFSSRQKEIYQIVLETQEYIAAQARPGLWLRNKEKPDQSLDG